VREARVRSCGVHDAPEKVCGRARCAHFRTWLRAKHPFSNKPMSSGLDIKVVSNDKMM
jgi:hypothetical protein